jgi:anti-anti-sigma factor
MIGDQKADLLPISFIITGSLTGNRAKTLEIQFIEEINKIISNQIILILRDVNHIDSQGVSLCVCLYKECLKKNLIFKIEAGPESMRILRSIQLDKILNIEEYTEI